MDAWQNMAVGWWSPKNELSLLGQGITFQGQRQKTEGIFDGRSYNYENNVIKKMKVTDFTKRIMLDKETNQ